MPVGRSGTQLLAGFVAIEHAISGARGGRGDGKAGLPQLGHVLQALGHAAGLGLQRFEDTGGIRRGGIALQPTYLVNPYLRSGELQAVLPGWDLPVMTIYALYPSRRHLSPAVRALLDFLVQRFEGAPW